MYFTRERPDGVQAPSGLFDNSGILGALADGSLTVRYGAQFDCRKQTIVAARARLAGRDASGVIDEAQTHGWDHLIFNHLLGSACLQMQHWRRLPQLERVVVPAKENQLFGALFVDGVQQTLRHANLAPTQLEIEIPDSTTSRYPGAAVALLRQLKTIGLSIAVTGSGTSHLSLAYLGRSLIDRITIDRKLVAAAPSDPDAIEQICTIVSVARNFGIEVAADGVDGEIERDLLLELGCDVMQGSLFGRVSRGRPKA